MKPHLSIFFLLAYLITHAQKDDVIKKNLPKKLIDKVGLIGGPSISGMWNSEGYRHNGIIKFGYIAGFEFTHSFNERFELSTLFLLERKGEKQLYEVHDSTGRVVGQGKYWYNSNYYSVVFLPKYFFGKQKRMEVGAGVYYSYLKNAEFVFIGYKNGSLNFTKYYTPYDLGLSVHVGYNFQFSEKVFMDIRFVNNLGLSKVALLSPFSVPLGKNNAYSMVICLKFTRFNRFKI